VAAAAPSAPLFTSAGGFAYTDLKRLRPILEQPIQTPDVVIFQLQEYLLKRVPALPTPTRAEEWSEEEGQLRKRVLNEIFFHGWPSEWVDASPKFESLGQIPSGKGYRIRKLRFEIVPGFQSTAILYEPENLAGKVPAILNFSGHSPQGKAADYEQKRCINYALRGMLALHPEWIGYGELRLPGNSHWFQAHLNLAGASGVGLFYLEMRRCLDYLYEHPNVDQHRIGATGLSGGGWQTIVLSSLDERVNVAIPVCGYAAFVPSIEESATIGDLEYNPPDLRTIVDYTTLDAMRAPRPTLLIYGAMDQYGYRAALEKPYLYEDIRPFYALYGRQGALAWHTNTDPGTHNYSLHNREQSYKFFCEHFGLPIIDHEISVDSQIKSYEELVVGLPEDNLTILGLAKNLAGSIRRKPLPSDPASRAMWAASARAKLRKIVRYQPATMKRVWAMSCTRDQNLETESYRFEFSNELSATGILLRAVTTPSDASIVVVLSDAGAQAMISKGLPKVTRKLRRALFPSRGASRVFTNCQREPVACYVSRGQQVLVLDLLLTGDASPDKRGSPTLPFGPSVIYSEALDSVGDRPIGIRVAQLLAVSKWLQGSKGTAQINLDVWGIRSQMAALIAAALEPMRFPNLVIHNGMRSLRDLFEMPVAYKDAPELFCLELYKEFDVDMLVAMAGTTRGGATLSTQTE
jgi:dienelactone hydrolase